MKIHQINLLKLIRIILFIKLAWVCFPAQSQHDPLYSQYMFNIQAYNPAYAGSWGNLGFSLLKRDQWLGFENNPSSQTLSIQAPFKNQRVGTGLTLINENLGLINCKSLFLDYSFGIPIGDKVNWRLGLKGGFSNYSNQSTTFQLVDPGDDAFSIFDRASVFMPNFGVGTYLSGQHFYFGFSIPRLLEDQETLNFETLEWQNFSAMGGVVIKIIDGLHFKPSAHLYSRLNNLMVTDLNASFLIAEKLWLGALYRLSDYPELGFNLNFIINDQLRIGYAYDFSQENNPSLSSGTHEVMVSFEFHLEKTEFVSPRYF